VIRSVATSIRFPPPRADALRRGVASPARTSSTSCSTVKPCASITASVQPSCGQSVSNSSARRRSGLERRAPAAERRWERASVWAMIAYREARMAASAPGTPRLAADIDVCLDESKLAAARE
jgi:hypothetical protein